MVQDEKYMQRALELAVKGEGYTSPNPMVGCVIVKDDKIIGEGYHEKYGQLHAERNALNNCNESSEGATLYVTLEPCSMCAGAMIQSRIQKLYFGAEDYKLIACVPEEFLKTLDKNLYTEIGFMTKKQEDVFVKVRFADEVRSFTENDVEEKTFKHFD